MAPYLDYRYVKISFKDDLRGQKSSFNRNSYCYDLSLRFFADLSDQLFLEKYLPATEEKYFKNFVEKLRTQYVETWFEVSWMSENDKKVAVDKFKGLKFIYPTIKKRKRIDLVKNYERMNFVQLVELLQRLRRNEDFRAAVNEEDTNDDWEERQNLIAYVFHFNKNKLFIPSAIAKDPFYQQKTKTQALNYGMTGQYLTGKMVMLVLNTGATIDSTLKTRDWWSAETTKQYKATLQCMTNAFKKTELEELPGTKLSNNEDTMEEYLGIQFAYEAYKKNVGNSDPTLLGYSLTGEQNFFISYAMRNCANLNVNGLRYLIKQGEIPEKYQVNVLLANTEAFAKAFSCPVGSAMNPKDKCKPY
ncbi:Membrane metallo-endopeptidase-like 1 isoform X2 [Aphelenchoides besseyi]|nr:Membrane metallo-endopeptidase-like 1 isoform X2 [Aphelenchoides besseyi]